MRGEATSGEVAAARNMLAQLDRTGSCARPVRIVAFREGHPDEDQVMLLPCKDRRSAVCPACSHTYKGDAWQVVATGLQGGKGVSPDVGLRPRVFATLTAPSFGAVHTRPSAAGQSHERSRACRRSNGRDRQQRCPHGQRSECLIHHGDDDPLLGQPICPRCFDYSAAVLWNAHVAVLWQRTAKRTLRFIERQGGVKHGRLRLSYVKAAEFQRRGLVHVHLVVRVDGNDGPDDPPPDWVTSEVIIEALRTVVPEAATSVPRIGGGLSRESPIGIHTGLQSRSHTGFGSVTGTGNNDSASTTIGWGHQMAVTVLAGGHPRLGPEDDRQLAVAAYVAKYATKTADSTGALTHRVHGLADIAKLPVNAHQKRLIETAWRLGSRPELADLGLHRCAHAFGYRGHVVTKSLRYSTTFAALRGARAAYRAGTGKGGFEPEAGTHFGYAGRGYDDPSTGMLAFHLAQLATRPGEGPLGKEGPS